jgi:hypothetical protein
MVDWGIGTVALDAARSQQNGYLKSKTQQKSKLQNKIYSMIPFR